MHHFLRPSARASKAALQAAGTGARRLLPTHEKADRWAHCPVSNGRITEL
jgi:hypothetical protein